MSSTIEQFREETRAWLEANCPASMRTPMPEDELIWGGARSSSRATISACGSNACATRLVRAGLADRVRRRWT